MHSSDCRSTKMLRFLVIALVLSGFLIDTCVQAVELPEAVCIPRPVVVPIDNPSHQYKPYQVILHRCRGTCGDSPPNLKGCVFLSQEEVTLSVFDIGQNKKTTITLTNHTSCECGCVTVCSSDNLMMHDENCRCKCIEGMTCDLLPPTPKVNAGKRQKGKGIPLEYMIGMALVGFFAVFVLVFDAVLCAKKRGFMYSVKHSCRGKTGQKEIISTTQNGSAITTTV